MAQKDRDDGPAQRAGTPPDEVQLTLARAQLALAETLRALSTGQMPAARSGASDSEDFPHSGVIELCDTDGRLYLVEADGQRLLLDQLAEQGKRLRLELELHPAVDIRTLSERDRAYFSELGSFFARSTAVNIAGAAQCNKPAPPPPKPGKAAVRPSPAPAPRAKSRPKSR